MQIACRHTTTGSFWRNTEDADVSRFLKLFTDLPMEEIARLGEAEGCGTSMV